LHEKKIQHIIKVKIIRKFKADQLRKEMGQFETISKLQSKENIGSPKDSRLKVGIGL
jgi:hypothetical protein